MSLTVVCLGIDQDTNHLSNLVRILKFKPHRKLALFNFIILTLRSGLDYITYHFALPI